MFNPISPIVPEVSVDQMRGLMALLTIIGNPNSKAAADLLKQLSDKADEAHKILASNDAKLVELSKFEKKHKAAMDALDSAKAEHEVEKKRFADIRKDFNSAHLQLGESQQKLQEAMTAHENRVQAHVEKERRLQDRESAVATKEKEVSSLLETLAVKQREFDAKIAPILAAAQLVRR